MKGIILKLSILFLLIFSCFSTTLASAEESETKVIYLTFDDGPGGKNTKQVLDILKEEGVPATFFLIGEQILGQEDLVNRIKNEEHSIGLHSMSHDKQKLYTSNENFLKEMIEEQKIISNITGETVNILRFPFGANNNFYKLKPSLIDLLHKNNFKIYDWNVDSTDGANPSAMPSLYVKKSLSTKNPIILLMHCGYLNKNSPKALKEIIKYYKSQNYVFKKITEDTPELYKIIK